jgi:hypothetical protein
MGRTALNVNDSMLAGTGTAKLTKNWDKKAGKFSVDKTNIDANVAPPPTPATPNELIITTATNVTINCNTSWCT